MPGWPREPTLRSHRNPKTQVSCVGGPRSIRAYPTQPPQSEDAGVMPGWPAYLTQPPQAEDAGVMPGWPAYPTQPPQSEDAGVMPGWIRESTLRSHRNPKTQVSCRGGPPTLRSHRNPKTQVSCRGGSLSQPYAATAIRRRRCHAGVGPRVNPTQPPQSEDAGVMREWPPRK
jgi:hypothetical protein